MVLVRQLEDDTWYVIGVTTDSIRLTTPRSATRSPRRSRSRARPTPSRATCRCGLYADGCRSPSATTFVTGRGDGVLGDFTGEIEFTNDTGATHGVLVLNGTSGEDGAPIEVSAIRVRL